MNPLEGLLQEELHRLVDRIAVRAGQDTAAGLTPELRGRIERCEDRLTDLRAALLEGYAEWSRALEACEDAWAVAGLRKEGVEAPPRINRRAA
ncbi:MAG TPA: hypothetical protein VIF59_14775 [Methylomirabilota bacterium]|jgi:hypothetical protein